MSLRFRIMPNMPPFHACGVAPTLSAMPATCRFTLSNSPVRLLIILPMSSSLSHSVTLSQRKFKITTSSHTQFRKAPPSVSRRKARSAAESASCRSGRRLRRQRIVLRPATSRRIVIGNPLKSSPDFPPLCTERAAFTALGAPSNSDVRASNTTYTLRYSFKFKD